MFFCVLQDLIYSFSCPDYGVESVELGARLVTVEQTLSILDTGLEAALYQLPSRISTAGEDILATIRGDNHDYGRLVWT